MKRRAELNDDVRCCCRCCSGCSLTGGSAEITLGVLSISIGEPTEEEAPALVEAALAVESPRLGKRPLSSARTSPFELPERFLSRSVPSDVSALVEKRAPTLERRDDRQAETGGAKGIEPSPTLLELRSGTSGKDGDEDGD